MRSLAYYAAFVVLPGMAGFLVFSVLDLTEAFSAIIGRFEAWEIDEILGALLFALLGLMGLAFVQREQARKAESKAEAYLQGVADALFVHTPSGRILHVNRYTCELLGYTQEELIGTSVFDHQESMTREDKAQVWERLTSGEHASLRLRKIRKDGTAFPAEIRLNLIELDGRKVILSVLRDVSVQQQIFAELQESEAKARAVFRAMPDVVCRIDEEGRFLDVWRGEATGEDYPEGWIEDKSIHDILELDVASEFMEKVGVAFRTDEIQTMEYIVATSKGAVEIEARIVAGDDGEAFYFARDVTERNRLFRQVSESERRNRAILESIPDLMFRVSGDGTYLYVDTKDHNRVVLPDGNLVGRKVSDVLPVEIAGSVMDQVTAALRSGRTQTYYQEVQAAGKDLCYDVRVVPSGADEVVYFARDITERQEMMDSLERAEAKNRAITEAIPDVIYHLDRDGTFLDVRTKGKGNLRLPKEELVRRRLTDTAQTPEIGHIYIEAIRETLDSGETRTFEYGLDMPDGHVHREARMVPSGPDEVICFVRDISERKVFEARIKRLAYYDSLTGLPNRYGFMQRLKEIQQRRGTGRVAVLIMNMKEFSRTNDSLGRDLGDSILQAIGEQVAKNFGGANSARLEGDEFAAVIEGLESEAEIERTIGQGLRYYEERPFSFGEMDFFFRARVGISFMAPGDSTSDVMRKASVALLEAKKLRESNYKVFDQTMKQRALWNLRLERDLRRAIQDGELGVHYQPEVYLKNGKVYSLEALARWQHPELGDISPGEFIPIAEETGLILPLGDYVLKQACRQMRLWREELPDAPCSVSVNVSAMQLRQRDFVSRVAELLEKNDLPKRCLQVEITESAAITDIESSIRSFSELRELGVGIALDDFGTGHSSLASLRQLPIDALKMDRSFNFQLEEDPRMSSIVAAVVELAHALDMRVISEGIETPEQLVLLKKLGCDIGQGYHFARPLPPQETLELLRSWRTLNLIRGSG